MAEVIFDGPPGLSLADEADLAVEAAQRKVDKAKADVAAAEDALRIATAEAAAVKGA